MASLSIWVNRRIKDGVGMEEKPIYELEVGELTRQQKHEDTPQSYMVVKSDTASGIMIYGKYGDEWSPNPNCRELVAHLLKAIGSFSDAPQPQDEDQKRCDWARCKKQGSFIGCAAVDCPYRTT